MKPNKVRCIALCIFLKNGRILVSRGYDSVKKQVFYRPVGGTIEFGEKGCDTVVREVQEELGLTASRITYLGAIESIFTYEGAKGHEIVLVYDGEFDDSAVYERQVLSGIEGDHDWFEALWKPVDAFDAETPVYPESLIDLLRGKL